MEESVKPVQNQKKKRSQSDKIDRWHWAMTSFAFEVWGYYEKEQFGH
jgi:hypothetical protein